MAQKDSMFLVELIIEGLQSYIDEKHYYITAQFADLFSIRLRDPTSTRKTKLRRRLKRARSVSSRYSSLEPKIETGNSILFESNIDQLVTNMTKYPIEISLYSTCIPDFKLGSGSITWSKKYIEYLNKIKYERKWKDTEPVETSEKYYIYHEFKSKRMASITLTIKLSNLENGFGYKRQSQEDDRFLQSLIQIDSALSNTFKTTKPFENTIEETGIIKTIYSTEKKSIIHHDKHRKTKRDRHVSEPSIKKKPFENLQLLPAGVVKEEKHVHSLTLLKSIITFVRSDTDIVSTKKASLIRTQSTSSIDYKTRLDTLNYIFGDPNGSYGNGVYYVGYFTVQNVSVSSKTGSPISKGSHSKSSSPVPSSDVPPPVKPSDGPPPVKPSDVPAPVKQYLKFKICDDECQNPDPVSKSEVSLDLPKDIGPYVNVTKCKQVVCEERKFIREPLSPPDDRTLIDLTSCQKECCKVAEQVEELVGGIAAKLIEGKQPCFCSCECKFGFTKNSTYCKICGGFEIAGEEVISKSPDETFPCPVFHKIPAGKKTASGSDMKKKKALELDKGKKETKKQKKEHIDDRFKFNYGYTAPKIGHSQCGFPCTGSLAPVPRYMGWLWTADNVPGLKYRPSWRPGAANKQVVRMLKIARNPEQVLAKRRKKDTGKKKRPLKRPLLIVQKKEGEYTVTMEAMKPYNKPRARNQPPYEDKDPITYTVGRTDEENKIRTMKKERKARRLEREQRDFIRNTFRNVCDEICMKTYRQALGMMPYTEDPPCPCYPAIEEGKEHGDVDHSCSCSDTLSSMGSDTDSDEWVIEFTPPNAFYDPAYAGKKISKANDSTQYTYLDYQVKLLDRLGNPVPRFFKGPDGKQQCSDLGGFWGPNHKWLEINTDGYIGPDGRWAPIYFIGPHGEHVDAEIGKFQTANGEWLVVGVDGYVDAQNKWHSYNRPKSPSKKKRTWKKAGPGGKHSGKKEEKRTKTEETWSCFGDASPKQIATMGLVGHGHDRKLLLTTLKRLMEQGEDVRVPQTSTVPRSGRRNKNHLSESRKRFVERAQCNHGKPSSKGILAVDERGCKTYFTLTNQKNMRPKHRLATLEEQGISLSSFHVPCLASFINSEVMKQQQYQHILEHNARYMKNVAGQTDK